MATNINTPSGPSPQNGDPTNLATKTTVFSTNQNFDAKAQLTKITPTFIPYPQNGHN